MKLKQKYRKLIQEKLMTRKQKKISDALVGNTNKKGKTLSDETKKNIGSYGK